MRFVIRPRELLRNRDITREANRYVIPFADLRWDDRNQFTPIASYVDHKIYYALELDVDKTPFL